MRLFRGRCVDSALFAASDFARMLIVWRQVIFPSIPSTSELSDGAVAMNVSFVESQLHRVATPPTLTTASAQPTDRAEELLQIQRWDQARERRYQTIRALRLLMEVHDQSNQLLNSLPTRSAPLSQGDDTLTAGRLFLTAEDDELTDRDAGGGVEVGGD